MWLTGWQYRKKITINGSSGAGTNYQVLLKVGESSGAAGADFHVNGHSAIFPSANNSGDLRFTASDGTTLLDFWVEKVEGTTPNRVAHCWVKVSADLGTNQDIYCYYGNVSATNVSSDTNTFIRVINGNQPLKLSFHLDEGSGTTAYDTSGNNNNGTLYNGPIWTNGKIKNALQFDGVDDYVDIPVSSGSALDFANKSAISVVVWAKALSNITSNADTFIGQDNSFFMRWRQGGANNWGGGINTGAWNELAVSGVLNTMTHLALTYDGATLNLYKDSVLGTSTSVSGNILGSSTKNITLGRFPTDANQKFNGILDEILIFNRALTAAEISDLYNYYGYTTTSYPGRVLVRKYVSPEPVFSSTGSEETSYNPAIPRRRLLRI